jgi:hypothetical protein
MEPKHSYGTRVYITNGFYHGYYAIIKSYIEVKTKNIKTEEEETEIIYTVNVQDTPKKDYEIPEKWIINAKSPMRWIK